jgi:RHH-type proline utilization regulon transcriptional repressor/proline dehydrogenase/delta 1-pyrroline-5-carboxylate dehydrogenase
VDLVVFTGSRAVGLGIVEKAARLRPGQNTIRKVIAELGGKNAVIVDADADLDQAVLGVMASAFGYQGQKCSACSRVIVHAAAYDRFTARLVEAVRGLRIGPPADPFFELGPVIDGNAREKINRYRMLARNEGTVLVDLPVPDRGHYVGPMVVTDLPAESRVLREEIFGPLLAVIKARDLDHALSVANDTPYALTGGLFSRSPDSIARVRRELTAGNVYVNRGITGAMVGRQPFGGFRLSGVGSKAGGPDYLLQFVDPRVVTENTVRRGFSPELLL